MPIFKCVKCEKEFCSKQSLTRHNNNKKPCVSKNETTKYRCSRCLSYFSTKQRMLYHTERKNKCEFYRHVVVLPTPLEKELGFEAKKEEMIGEMKKEFKIEILKIYKSINNIAIRIKNKEKLISKFNENMKRLHKRKTLPDTMLSVIEQKQKFTDTSDKLVTYHNTLKKRIKKAEEKINKLHGEHEDTILGINSILDDLSTDREKVLKIRKELKSRCDIHLLSYISETDISETD